MLFTCPSLAPFFTGKGKFSHKSCFAPFTCPLLAPFYLKYAGFHIRALVCSYPAFPWPHSLLKEIYYPTGSISVLSFICPSQASFFLSNGLCPHKRSFLLHIFYKRDLLHCRSNFISLTVPVPPWVLSLSEMVCFSIKAHFCCILPLFSPYFIETRLLPT